MPHLKELGSWTAAFKEFAFAGSAFVIAGSVTRKGMKENGKITLTYRISNSLFPYAKYPLSLMMVVFGIDHFLYPAFVASLVPAWIPGNIFWTYFAGLALIAGGLGIILNIKARLAANLLGIMLFIWLIILHIPHALADPSGSLGNEWTSVFEALAYSGIAFILGQTLAIRRKLA